MSANSGSLTQLIYLSRQTQTDPVLANEDVDAIIRASIRNNRSVGVTGLLLIHDGWFLQALEGSHTAVADTYHRILTDPRHTDARVLDALAAENRSFGDWNMCARRMADADEAILDRLFGRSDLDLVRLDGRNALRLLKAVRGVQQNGATQLRA